MSSVKTCINESEKSAHLDGEMKARQQSQDKEMEKSDKKRSPPESAKTAFMCFVRFKEKELTDGLSLSYQKSDDCIRKVAEEWKRLDQEGRAKWEEEAKQDKLRFEKEKASNSGNWILPKRRAKKHPLAPRRPMSAFLKFSQTRRKIVKKQNPDMSNTDVSRVLGEIWRTLKPSERNPYIQEEMKERSRYKAEIAKFKSELARREAFSNIIEKENINIEPTNLEYNRERECQMPFKRYYPHNYESERHNNGQEYFSEPPNQGYHYYFHDSYDHYGRIGDYGQAHHYAPHRPYNENWSTCKQNKSIKSYNNSLPSEYLRSYQSHPHTFSHEDIQI